MSPPGNRRAGDRHEPDDGPDPGPRTLARDALTCLAVLVLLALTVLAAAVALGFGWGLIDRLTP